MVSGLQGAFECGLLTGGKAVKGLIQTVEHGVGAQLVADALLGIHRLPIDEGVQIDAGEITLLGGAIHADQGAEALTEVVQTLVDILIADFGLGDLNLHAVQVGQVELGANLHLRGELQLGLVLGRLGNILDINLRLVHGVELLLRQGLGVNLGDAGIDGFACNAGETDTLVDDGAGHMSLAEAGDGDLLADLLAGLVQVRVQLVRIDGDCEPDLGGLEVPDADFHAALQFIKTV